MKQRFASPQEKLNHQLIDALVQSDTKTALALVNAGADPNTRFTPPPIPMLKRLFDILQYHAPTPAYSSTALMIACGSPWKVMTSPLIPFAENLPLLKAMLAHGGSVHTRESHNFTALHFGANWGRGDTVELLLQHGADINAQDEWGNTPLMMATYNDTVDMVRLLLSHGANLHVQDEHGNTALHLAVESPVAEGVISELLAHGATPNLRNKYGNIALELVQQEEYSNEEYNNIARLLKQHGAK
jgi:ankyrin repeat protein